MVLHRHNDITLQNDAVSVPQFIGTVIHATNVQRHPAPLLDSAAQPARSAKMVASWCCDL